MRITNLLPKLRKRRRSKVDFDLSTKTACLVDNGLFVELGIRLARDFGRVLYYNPGNQKGFPTITEAMIGDGMGEIERIDSFWPLKNEIDCFVFPDINSSAIQLELISQGKPVWGSRAADRLEQYRAEFKGILMELGLEVGPYKVCHGLDELKAFLFNKKDRWIKFSKYRGSFETRGWVDYDTSRDVFDLLAIKFGPAQNIVNFIVEETIKTKVEWGYDGYFAGGKFPARSAQGVEEKDKCYIGAITEWADLPSEVRMINEAITPILAKFGYANFWSTELRITEDDKVYFIDPTCRMPSPAGEAQMELYGNLSEIIWAGAHGQCLDPEPTAKFCAEAIIDHNGDEQYWRRLVVSDEVRRFVKLYNVCKIDDAYCIPPLEHSCDSIGAVIGLGDTIEEAIEHLKENEKALNGQPITIHSEDLADALAEIHHADQQGIELTNEPVPDPAVVLQD